MKKSKLIKLLAISFGVALVFLVSTIAIVASDYIFHDESGQLYQMNDDDGVPTVISVISLDTNNQAAENVDTNEMSSRNVTKIGNPSATASPTSS